MQIADLPAHQRPREKLREKGVASLSETELLALILRTGYRGQSAVEVAERLLEHQSLLQFLTQPDEKLRKLKGIGPVTAGLLTAIAATIEIAKQTIDRPAIVEPEQVYNLTQSLCTKKQEHLILLLLNGRNQLIDQQTVTIGTLNSSLIHAREVFAPAIAARAAGLIIVHNHPSGSLEPSDEDLTTTDKLVEAGQLLDIPILDHVIVSTQGFFSFKHHQLL